MHLYHPSSWWERLAGFFNHRRKLLRTYAHFRRLLCADHRCHQCMAALERVQGEDLPVDFHKVRRMAALLERQTERLVKELTAMAPRQGRVTAVALERVRRHMAQAMSVTSFSADSPLALSMDEAAGVEENLLGGKAHQAARLKDRGLFIPRFFVLTTKAFAHVLAHNRLEDEVARRLGRLDVSDPEKIRRTAHELCRMVEDCALPQDLLEAMDQAHRRVFGNDADSVFLCVRSSAVGEDRAHSFAGQYLSVLNVPASALPDAYRRVIASKYTANAIAHRICNGYLDEETPMAVLVMETVNACRSGVAYSADPAMGDARRLFVHGVWGMGETLMRGDATPHVVTLDRTTLSILENSPQLSKQLEKQVVHPDGGLKRRPLTAEERRTGPVDGPLARLLAQQLLICEELLSGPVDMEWAVDSQGQIWILQARPLFIQPPRPECAAREAPPNERLVLSGGECACPGTAVGRVVRVTSPADLCQVPHGAVLTTSTPFPELALIADRLEAVLTDAGSVAGHFASIAREKAIPMMVNTGSATTLLLPDRIVTVDATARRVYAGRVPGLLDPACRRGRLPADRPIKARLHQLLQCISPLHLKDAASAEFLAQNCSTIHDILRFCHETALREMFGAHRRGRTVRGARKFVTDLPFQLYILDLGGGIVEKAARPRDVYPQDVANPLFQAFWKGLSSPCVHWNDKMRHMDWELFDRVSAGVFSLDSQLLASFALLSRDYVNVHLRFGYHFAVIDALSYDASGRNHLRFAFMGGGADLRGRQRRIVLLERVLESCGLSVERQGDRLEAQARDMASHRLPKIMEVLGHLLGITRLLDMYLQTEDDVWEETARFFAAHPDVFHRSFTDISTDAETKPLSDI